MRLTRIAVAVCAASMLALFTMAPAGAIDRNVELAQTHGFLYMCTGGSTDGDIATICPPDGRDLGIVRQTNTYDDPNGLCQQFEGQDCAVIVMYAGDDPTTGKNECVAATTNDTVVKLKPCSGSDGVNWAVLCLDGSQCLDAVYINTWSTANHGNIQDQVLSSTSTSGQNMACLFYTAHGFYQDYTGIAS